MKKLGLILMMLVLFVGFSSSAYAITVNAFINPFWGGSYDGNSTSGTARIDIFSDIAFDAGTLNFGNSNGVDYAGSGLAIITPGGWNVGTGGGSFNFFLIGSAGSPTSTNQLAFEFDFTLTQSLNQMAAEVNDGDLLTAPDGWRSFFGSDAPWSMNGAIFEDVNNNPLVFSPFSTILVPEPGTVMLLGFGLLGLGFFARRRRSDS